MTVPVERLPASSLIIVGRWFESSLRHEILSCSEIQTRKTLRISRVLHGITFLLFLPPPAVPPNAAAIGVSGSAWAAIGPPCKAPAASAPRRPAATGPRWSQGPARRTAGRPAGRNGIGP